MKTTITCLGHGHAFSPPEIGNSSYLVEHDHQRILLDCGALVPHAMKELGIDPGSITDIVVSHIHSDHFSGLENLLYHRMFISKAGPVRLHMGPEVADHFRILSSLTGSGLRDPRLATLMRVRRCRLMQETEEVIPGLTVEYLEASHGRLMWPMPCYSFALHVGDKRIFFSGDRVWNHVGDEHIFRVMAEADLVLHELEVGETPSGVHTHVSDVPIATNAFKKFRWHHHGLDPESGWSADLIKRVEGFNLMFKGCKVEL